MIVTYHEDDYCEFGLTTNLYIAKALNEGWLQSDNIMLFDSKALATAVEELADDMPQIVYPVVKAKLKG